MPEPIVGIDLGTTNSLVAIYESGGARVIPDERGRGLLPSVVRYEFDGVLPTESAGKAPEEEARAVAGGAPLDSISVGSGFAQAHPSGRVRVVVGHDARQHAAEFPATTISSVKRLMGRSRQDAAGDLAFLSYTVVEGPHQTARVALPLWGEEVVVSPQEVSAAVLRALKDRASAALGVEVRRAVVTVPAYFDHAQREATRDAGRIAGLEVVRIVPEPTAAALAYGLGTPASGGPRSGGGRTVAVYDLGGGTFDVSILRLTPRSAEAREGGEGGTDFFQVLSTAGDTHLGGDDLDQMLVDVIQREIGREVSAGARQALRAAGEAAKCRLSEAESATVEVTLDGRAYRREVTRGELEALAAPWVDRTIASCERALRDAKGRMGGAAIDVVILVGGATRMPIVRRRVREFFGIEPYTAMNPDEVVALGAAVQAGILAGAVQGALLLDVIPLSLGIETVGGAVAKIIFKNSTVPARATEMFSTSVDGQTSIKLNVLQGEREMAADCRGLGLFHLRGIPPMPAGVPQVEVEFLVDANGVLNVGAHERRSGRRASLQVVPNHGLTREEVERIESESLAHAREDMTRHRIVDLVANSKLDLKWIGERLERYGDKLEPGNRDELVARIAELRGMVNAAERDWTGVDADAFFTAKNLLDRASVRLQEVGIAESLREDLEQAKAGKDGG